MVTCLIQDDVVMQQYRLGAMRKESDTTDDPRILKLDDDFMYEDTVNV